MSSGSASSREGLVLRGWAAGTRASIAPAQGEEVLVTGGPYGVIRHPVHAANFLIVLGIVVLAESGVGLVIVPAMLFGASRIIAGLEEESLQNQFGESYMEYSREVPRWIPRRMPTLASSDRFSWSALKHEYHVAATVAAVGILAELTESMPHLFG